MNARNSIVKLAAVWGIATIAAGIGSPAARAEATAPKDAAGPSTTAGADASPSVPSNPTLDSPVSQLPERQPKPHGDDFVGPIADILDAASMNVSFQALLTDAGGTPLPGATVDLEFNVYTTGGVVVDGPIQMLGVAMNNGVVDTQVPVSRFAFDGSGRELGVKVNGGSELSPRTKLTAVPYAYRVDRVENPELTDNVELGTLELPGSLKIFPGAAYSTFPAITAVGSDHEIQILSDRDEITAYLRGATFGELGLAAEGAAPFTAILSAGDGKRNGGELRLAKSDGHVSVLGKGDNGTLAAEGSFDLVETIGGALCAQIGKNGSGGGVLRTRDENGAQTLIAGSVGTGGGGFINVHMDSSIWPGVTVDGDDGNGGSILLKKANDFTTIEIDANGTSDSGPFIGLKNSNGDYGASMRGDYFSGGIMVLGNGEGTATVQILGRQSGSNANGRIHLASANALGQIILETDWDGNNNSRIVTDTLAINGGSDFSEQFDVNPGAGSVKPGMVVSIDADNPGKLVVSGTPYDCTVAGVISGAGGVMPGMLMGQADSIANGEHPVALTGRVYCYADATFGAIKPGDLLTTSGNPGHAMKAADRNKSHGAILGKAMTSLKEGTGLVLVLVNLQ